MIASVKLDSSTPYLQRPNCLKQQWDLATMGPQKRKVGWGEVIAEELGDWIQGDSLHEAHGW